MRDDEVKRLADCVRDCSFHLHSFLKWGHLEKVYENGLAHRLEKAGVAVERQFRIPVLDLDGTVLGDYIADLIVQREMILEIKACESLLPIHTTQVLGYGGGGRDLIDWVLGSVNGAVGIVNTSAWL